MTALFTDPTQTTADLDKAIAGGIPFRADLNANKAHCRSTCDRCPGRARYSGLGGSWCAGCWQSKRKQVRPALKAADLLTRRYGLESTEQLVDCLSDAGGFVRVRASASVVCRLRYHPDPSVLVECLLASDSPAQRLGLQLNALARIWFGLALRWGVDLHGYPRDGYPAPDEIPWGVVTWAEGDLRAYRWLVKTSLMVRAAYMRRYNRDHGGAAQLSFVLPLCADLGGFLRVQKGALSTPQNVHLERRPDSRFAA